MQRKGWEQEERIVSLWIESKHGIIVHWTLDKLKNSHGPCALWEYTFYIKLIYTFLPLWFFGTESVWCHFLKWCSVSCYQSLWLTKEEGKRKKKKHACSVNLAWPATAKNCSNSLCKINHVTTNCLLLPVFYQCFLSINENLVSLLTLTDINVLLFRLSFCCSSDYIKSLFCVKLYELDFYFYSALTLPHSEAEGSMLQLSALKPLKQLHRERFLIKACSWRRKKEMWLLTLTCPHNDFTNETICLRYDLKWLWSFTLIYMVIK